jgi:hypothetical protein
MRTRSSPSGVLRPRPGRARPDDLSQAATRFIVPAQFALMIRGNPSQPRDPEEAGCRLKPRDPGKDGSSVHTSRTDLGCTCAAGTIPAYFIAMLVARRTEICPGPHGRITTRARCPPGQEVPSHDQRCRGLAEPPSSRSKEPASECRRDRCAFCPGSRTGRSLVNRESPRHRQTEGVTVTSLAQFLLRRTA